MPPEEIQEEVVDNPLPGGEPAPTAGEEGKAPEGEQPEAADAEVLSASVPAQAPVRLTPLEMRKANEICVCKFLTCGGFPVIKQGFNAAVPELLVDTHRFLLHLFFVTK